MARDKNASKQWANLFHRTIRRKTSSVTKPRFFPLKPRMVFLNRSISLHFCIPALGNLRLDPFSPKTFNPIVWESYPLSATIHFTPLAGRSSFSVWVLTRSRSVSTCAYWSPLAGVVGAGKGIPSLSTSIWIQHPFALIARFDSSSAAFTRGKEVSIAPQSHHISPLFWTRQKSWPEAVPWYYSVIKAEAGDKLTGCKITATISCAQDILRELTTRVDWLESCHQSAFRERKRDLKTAFIPNR